MKLAALYFALSVVWLARPTADTAQSRASASDRPTFEVASIKSRPVMRPLKVSTGIDPAGIQYRNVTVTDCVRNAFGVQRYQIVGGPDWLRSDRYDIIAKAPSPPTPKAQLMLMLQTLLEERFKLKTHLELRDLPIYALVVGKHGPRLKPGKADGNTEIGGAGHLIDSRGMTMQALAGFLSQITQGSGRPVVDRTGLDGVFDITLDFVPDDLAVDNNSDPNVFAALQALGLKLEPQKSPFEVRAIDHIERPSED
jgi:uncharacterized protein (TIGR03435 family)